MEKGSLFVLVFHTCRMGGRKSVCSASIFNIIPASFPYFYIFIGVFRLIAVIKCMPATRARNVKSVNPFFLFIVRN